MAGLIFNLIKSLISFLKIFKNLKTEKFKFFIKIYVTTLHFINIHLNNIAFILNFFDIQKISLYFFPEINIWRNYSKLIIKHVTNIILFLVIIPVPATLFGFQYCCSDNHPHQGTTFKTCHLYF